MPNQSVARINVIEKTLADRSLVSTFNANRIDEELKWRSEAQWAIQIIRSNQQLQDCAPETIRNSMLEVAYSGLSLAPSLGHGYLIPYGKVCTFKPGYKGIMHLCYKANTLARIQTGLDKEGDKYRKWTDETGTHLLHEEHNAGDRSAKRTLHAYVIAKLTNGEHIVTDMDAEALGKIEWAATHKYDTETRAWVDNPKGGMVWRGPFRSQMEIKSVIRRGSSYWPRDDGGRLEHAMAVMDKYDGLDFEPKARNDEPTEVLVNEKQALELHAALTDRGLDGTEASQWLRLKAQALGYRAIEELPARLFEQIKTELIERWNRVEAGRRERAERDHG